MNQVNQCEGSVFSFTHQVTKRRGRPRKETRRKRARAPPGFEGKQEYHPLRAYKTNIDGMVGQVVTGVVQATFDAGYLLTVRIGNSNTDFRGVVFKPGHSAPISNETDVAPHLQMIKRNDVRLPHEHEGWPQSQKLSIQTAAGLVPAKLKFATPVTSPSIPTLGTRGTVVPVVLQPVNNSNGYLGSNQMPSGTSRAPHVMAFGTKDDHMVGSSAMLPPDQSIASQIFITTQPNSSHQVTKESKLNDQVTSLNEGNSEAGHVEKLKPMKSTDVDTPDSPQSTDNQVESDSEDWKSSPENSGVVSNQETGNSNEPFLTESAQTTFVAKPLFTYGTGRMTELLKAVQENMKDIPMQIAEQLSFASQVEYHATRSEETDPKNEASSP